MQARAHTLARMTPRFLQCTKLERRSCAAPEHHGDRHIYGAWSDAKIVATIVHRQHTVVSTRLGLNATVGWRICATHGLQTA